MGRAFDAIPDRIHAYTADIAGIVLFWNLLLFADPAAAVVYDFSGRFWLVVVGGKKVFAEPAGESAYPRMLTNLVRGRNLMKVFRLECDVNNYQKLFPENDDVWDSGVLEMDCISKIDSWQPPRVFSLRPRLKAGDFWAITSGAVVVTHKSDEPRA